MKKVVPLSLIATLILYLFLLPRYLVIDDVVALYLFPVVLFGGVSTIIYGVKRIFKQVSYGRRIRRSLIVACVFQLLMAGLVSWSLTPRYFAREKVVADIDYAARVMEDVHPDLYATISKKEFDAATDSIKRTLPVKVSHVETYKILRKVFAQIKDGHTSAGWNFSYNPISILFRKTLPYRLAVKGNRLFVVQNNFYRKRIPIGSEILKINGQPADQCIRQVSTLISYENNPFRNDLLSSPGLWALWNNFHDFEITYKPFGSDIARTIRTSGGLISNLMALRRNIGSDYTFRVLPGNIGLINFNHFRHPEKFKVFLDSTFRSIRDKNVTDLIIDIRRNGGGNSMLGNELMQYISPTGFRMADSVQIKISNEVMERNQLAWLDTAQYKPGMVYHYRDTSNIKLRQNPLRFSGNTYLLAGGHTYSSATLFASAFRRFHAGKIIGTETGGLTVCYGDVYKFLLPNTKYNMRVSYKKFFNAGGIDNRRGIIPDYVVSNSFNDDRRGIDRAMQFAIQLIGREN